MSSTSRDSNIELQQKMAAANGARRPPLADDAIGPCQLTPQKELDGKTENFDEFAFKLQAISE